MKNRKMDTMSAMDPGSLLGESTDSTNILERAKAGSLCHGMVEELSRDLPGDDAVIAEWLEAAQKEHDDNLFTILLFTALAAGREVDARILIDGAALLPDTQYLAIEEKCEDEKENALLEDAPPGVQAIRIPNFSERFRRSIESHSVPTATSALRLIGRLAAGDASAFAGSKRLQANHSIMRQRIGIKHRLLFSTKGESLEIIDLIDRKDLEKVIRNYG